jgi:hypothetical protein
MSPPTADDSLVEAALKVLTQPDPWLKAEYTYKVVDLWNTGLIKDVAPDVAPVVPDRPSRDDAKVQSYP